MKCVFLLIFFLSLPGLCQEDEFNEGEIRELENRVHIIDGNTEVPLDAINTGTNLTTDLDDEDISKLEQERRNQLKNADKLNEGRKAITEVPEQVVEDLKKLGTLSPNSMFDEKSVGLLKKLVAQNNLSVLTHEEIKSVLREKIKGRPAEKLFSKFPKLLDISAGIIGDKEALVSLVGIVQRKDDLGLCSLAWFGLFILGFLIKKFFFSKEWPFLKRLSYSICLSTLIFLTSLGIFYSMFQEELGPSLKVIVKHL